MPEKEQCPSSSYDCVPPVAMAAGVELAPAESSEEQQLRAFVGEGAISYLKEWARLRVEGGYRGGFNWAAFFLTGLWLLYRKMYKLAAYFWGIVRAEMIIEDLVFVGILREARTPRGSSVLVGILTGLICGAYGNRWYLSHARKTTSDVRAQGLEPPAVCEALPKRGGTSPEAALGYGVLYTAIGGTVLFVLEHGVY